MRSGGWGRGEASSFIQGLRRPRWIDRERETESEAETGRDRGEIGGKRRTKNETQVEVEPLTSCTERGGNTT